VVRKSVNIKLAEGEQKSRA